MIIKIVYVSPSQQIIPIDLKHYSKVSKQPNSLQLIEPLIVNLNFDFHYLIVNLVSGKFYPSFKESPLAPVNAVCMKGELISCQEITLNQIRDENDDDDDYDDDSDGDQLVQHDKLLLKSMKHRRKTILDNEVYLENNSIDTLNDGNSADNNINSEQLIGQNILF